MKITASDIGICFVASFLPYHFRTISREGRRLADPARETASVTDRQPDGRNENAMDRQGVGSTRRGSLEKESARASDRLRASASAGTLSSACDHARARGAYLKLCSPCRCTIFRICRWFGVRRESGQTYQPGAFERSEGPTEDGGKGGCEG
eukprot:2761010-Pleurochrysis_carterae.AAC.2